MFDIEKIYEPQNLDDALKYLDENENSIVICGGSDVLIKNREGKLRGLDYVCIRDLPELKEISIDENGTIFIGSACSFTTIENNPIINKYCDFLSYAVGQVGGPQIRNIGTIGGNICNGVPSADSATSVVILESKLHLKSVNGTRVVNVDDFFIGAGKTIRKQNEILTKIEIPKKAYHGYYGLYTKYAMRKAMDIATMGVAMKVKLNSTNDKIEDIKIAYGVAAATPIRGKILEKNLIGKNIDENLIKLIDDFYLEDISPRDSWRASKEFRKQIVNELLKRSISKACVKAGGKNVYSC